MKEAEKRKKQAQKEAREKAEREAKAEQKRVAEERKKEDEAKQAAARLQKLGPLGRTGAKLQVELETGWADCGEDEVKQVCDSSSGRHVLHRLERSECSNTEECAIRKDSKA